jgi:hypothetical protein
MRKFRIPSGPQIVALWLQDVYGLSVAEIAEHLKTTPKAVESLLYRIRHNEDFMRRLPEKTQKRQKRRTRHFEPSMEGQIERQF